MATPVAHYIAAINNIENLKIENNEIKAGIKIVKQIKKDENKIRELVKHMVNMDDESNKENSETSENSK